MHDKSHLVPFGEYIPFGDLLVPFGIRAFAAQEGFGYTPGAAIRVLDLGRAGRVLPLICYEAIFAQDLNRAVGQADWILQITNDGWFGDISGPYQHLAQTRLRAIEQGLPVLRVANTGVSGVIDAAGQLLHALPLNTEGALDVAVPRAAPATLRPHRRPAGRGISGLGAADRGGTPSFCRLTAAPVTDSQARRTVTTASWRDGDNPNGAFHVPQELHFHLRIRVGGTP